MKCVILNVSRNMIWNMKYDERERRAKIWNMKYENMKIWKYDEHEQKYEIWNIDTKMLHRKFIVVA